MKLKLIPILLISLLFGKNITAQTTETFETETMNSTSFTDNSQIFNITTQLSGVQPFDIQTAYPNTGWNGTAADNNYIDNSSGTVNGQGVGFTITSAGNVPFLLNSFWLYLSDHSLNLTGSGTVTVVGKLAGVTKFTASSSSGFNTNSTVAKGFTLIDFTTFGGSNNTAIPIDQVVITTTATFEYVALDAFKWTTISCTAPVIRSNPPNRMICVNGNTTFPSSATGANAYQWQVNTGSGFVDITNGGVYSNATTNTLTITGVTGIMNGYTYRCKAMNGSTSCFTNTNSATLNVSNMISSTAKNDVLCFGLSTGSAAVSAPTGGIGSVTYSWAPYGGTNSIATGLAAGNYTCTITDGLSCQITKTITINQPASALNGATGGGKTDVSCNGGSNGTATVAPTGGTPAYTYSWAPSGGTNATATGLAAGTYTCTVTDANNCQVTRSFTINQPATALSAATGARKTIIYVFLGTIRRNECHSNRPCCRNVYLYSYGCEFLSNRQIIYD